MVAWNLQHILAWLRRSIRFGAVPSGVPNSTQAGKLASNIIGGLRHEAADPSVKRPRKFRRPPYLAPARPPFAMQLDWRQPRCVVAVHAPGGKSARTLRAVPVTEVRLIVTLARCSACALLAPCGRAPCLWCVGLCGAACGRSFVCTARADAFDAAYKGDVPWVKDRWDIIDIKAVNEARVPRTSH